MANMDAATAAGIPQPSGQPEIIDVPAVPDGPTLFQTMTTVEGQVSMVQDIYVHLGNIGGNLRDHVSSSGVSHNMIDLIVNAQSRDQAVLRNEMTLMVNKISTLENEVQGLKTMVASGAAMPSQPPGLDFASHLATALASALGPALAGASGGVGQAGKSPLQDLRAMQNVKEFNNDKTVTFKRWQGQIRGIVERADYGRQLLIEAVKKGSEPL